MLIRVISNYLRTHKRLVIPQLGVLLVKEPGGTVLFSELVRRDDGVLHALLVEAGMSELAAAGEIDRFVFEVRHAVEQGKSCPAAGLGIWSPGPHGTIAFAYRPAQTADAPASAAPLRAGREMRPAVRGAAVAEGRSAEEPAVGESAVPPARETADGGLSVSAKMNPPSHVKGLNYGRPPKHTDAFTYVDKPVRRTPDRFVLAAIAALVIALCAIAYGYYHDLQERRAADRMIEMLEQAAQPEGEAQ